MIGWKYSENSPLRTASIGFELQAFDVGRIVGERMEHERVAARFLGLRERMIGHA